MHGYAARARHRDRGVEGRGWCGSEREGGAFCPVVVYVGGYFRWELNIKLLLIELRHIKVRLISYPRKSAHLL